MKYDIVIAGIGGQGVSSLARLIAHAAARGGLECVASPPSSAEGTGGRFAHLRLADRAIAERGIKAGQADLILGLEPLETLRHLAFLSPAGSLITSSDPLPQEGQHYPPVADVLWSVLTHRSGFLVDATRLAADAGMEKMNAVMAGAASDFLPIDPGDLRAAIIDLFSEMGTVVVEQNLAAFEAGRSALRHREVVDEFTTFAEPGR